MPDQPATKTVMVVGAHPDDPEFGAAGTVARWVQQGWTAVYVLCTNGDKGSSDPTMTSERLAVIREAEQRKAAAIVGAREVVFLGCHDGGLEDTPEFRGQIVRLIRKHRPDIVMTHDPWRRYMVHRDHRIAGQVTLDAVFPYSRDRLFYPEHEAEGLKPHKVLEVYLFGAETPDTVVEIEDTLGTKMKAIACHVSQVGDHTADWDKWVKEYRERMSRMNKRQDQPMAELFRRIELRR